MSKVKIKFKPYFKEPMLSGTKVCTARTKRMGEPGDIFAAFGAQFRLMSVTDEMLTFVADLWYPEGCTSREHFLAVWKQIHPVAKYNPQQIVKLHRFKKVMP